MNCNWNRLERANRAAGDVALAIKQNRWKDVLKAVEEWPELLFWDRLEANMGTNLFLQVWEEDRWIGRQIVRMLLERPGFWNKISLPNYGFSTFQVNREDHWVFGPLLGLLAGAGELELMEEGLKAGLDPNGWTDGGWYEGTEGFYYFNQPSSCSLHKNSHRGHPFKVVENNETTPLLIAILRDDVEMVKLLIRYGAAFVPKGKLCQDYLKELSSWTIRDLLAEAYGGVKTHG
ncbi:MAG: ankyrin repeat domain-containing protein [Firmicutes bacterium]|nr:ankyrin repeat domain-containing protein [Bacillota bacterium]